MLDRCIKVTLIFPDHGEWMVAIASSVQAAGNPPVFFSAIYFRGMRVVHGFRTIACRPEHRVGALLYLPGFLFRDQLILRGLIILGDLVYILYFYFAPEIPLREEYSGAPCSPSSAL
jgi:hypothetical protein